ncbi:MAG: hypothetical protein HA495_00555 [Thaumarchaeota archaeon]|nr:hypothetical protein [Nitrososphaerota archaeon]
MTKLALFVIFLLLFIPLVAAEPPVLRDANGNLVGKANSNFVFELVEENGEVYKGNYTITLLLISKFCDYNYTSNKVFYYNGSRKVLEVYNFTLDYDEEIHLRFGEWKVLAVYVKNENVLRENVSFFVPIEGWSVRVPIKNVREEELPKVYVSPVDETQQEAVARANFIEKVKETLITLGVVFILWIVALFMVSRGSRHGYT